MTRTLHASSVLCILDALDKAVTIMRADPGYSSSQLPRAVGYVRGAILLEMAVADVAVEAAPAKTGAI